MIKLTTSEYFEPVLEWLDAGAPHKNFDHVSDVGFNMSHFKSAGRGDYLDQECGTACCIAGVLLLFHPTLLDFRYQWSVAERIYFIAEQIGMTSDAALRLFIGYGANLESIHPDYAARTIRHYLATGEVDWKAIQQ